MANKPSLQKTIDDHFGIQQFRVAESLLSETESDLPEGENERRLGQIAEAISDEIVPGNGESLSLSMKEIAESLSPEDIRDHFIAVYTNPDTCLPLMATTLPSEVFVGWIEGAGLDNAIEDFGSLCEDKLMEVPDSFWADVLDQLRSITVDVTGQEIRRVITGQGAIDSLALASEAEVASSVKGDPKTFLALLTGPNRALVEFREARNGWGNDMEKALQTFWDLGFRAGGPESSWPVLGRVPDSTAEEQQRTEGFQDAAVRQIEVLLDVSEKNDLDELLWKGATDKLLPLLRRASYNDFLDERRRSNAEKRVGNKPIRVLEDIPENEHPHDLAATQELADREAWIDQEIAISRASLSEGERETLLLRLGNGSDEGQILSFREVAKILGVSESTAKEHWRRAATKLRALSNHLNS